MERIIGLVLHRLSSRCFRIFPLGNTRYPQDLIDRVPSTCRGNFTRTSFFA
ncbi:MAG: hypothetical protein JWP25_8106 [Bradyrhizobium sp.]|jgi:hypothetical protein|nr:hypothetical protein [Bradyrhizobium sp.]